MYSYTTTLPFLNMFPGAGFMYMLGLLISLTLEECCVVPTSCLLKSFSLKAKIFALNFERCYFDNVVYAQTAILHTNLA